MGQVLLRPRPRPRPPRDRRRRASARRGSGWSRRTCARCRPTTTAATSPRGGSSTGSTPGRASGPAGCDAALAAGIGAQARHVRATLTPERNHRTLELYALLLAALAVPGVDGDGALRRFALAELDRNLAERLPPRRRPPRGVEPLPHDRPALVHGRARERPPLRPRAAGRVRGPARARLHVRAPLPPARRAHPGALGRRHRAATRSCWRSPTSCSARPATRARASPTAATTCSAAAGTRTRATPCSTAARSATAATATTTC